MSQPQEAPLLLDPGAALREELRHLRGIPDDAKPEWFDPEENDKAAPLSALCFSGGGIRSAAFNLGVARALSRYGLLGRFDYLSTVSGGGYIGAWLQTLIREESQRQVTMQGAATHAQSVDAVQADLASPRPSRLKELRNFGNFLTPQVGIGSLDTWAGVALYMRNLLLNWLMMLPVFLLVVTAPILYRTGLWQLGLHGWVTVALVAADWCGLVLAVFRTATILPSHRAQADPDDARKVGSAIRWIVTTELVWAFAAPAALKWATEEKNTAIAAQAARAWSPLLWPPQPLPLAEKLATVPALTLPILQFLALMIGFILAWAATSRARGLFGGNFLRWIVASLGSSVLFALVIWFADPFLHHRDAGIWLTQFGPVVMVLLFVTQTSFYIGLRHEAERSDLDREFLARLDGTAIAITIGWAAFAFACVSLGPLLQTFEFQLKGGAGAATAATAAASGGLAAWLAKQAASWADNAAKSATFRQHIVAYLPTILSVAFLVGLLALLGMALQETLGWGLTWVFAAFEVTENWITEPLVVDGKTLYLPAGWVHIVAQFTLALVFYVLVTQLRRININRFSMHGTYRNRLVRAFMGSPRQERPGNEWFTGFDEQDNYALAALKACDDDGQKLFPVVNMTLNHSADGPAGTAERQGSSFTATPLRCGSVALGGQDPARAYIRTAVYAGLRRRGDDQATNHGISYGSVITASGAAASPHWGYHTSALTSFVMTLFNVRLGLWLPNPAVTFVHQEDLFQSRPPDAIAALLADLLGRTRLDNRAIYLSDGGHFDNLGLYEMLRRRCKYIVVVDAGADPDCAFFDLGMAIRKAEIDLPVRVTMGDMRIHSRANIEKEMKQERSDAIGIAVGTITYLGTDPALEDPPALTEPDMALDGWWKGTTETGGKIIYIKPSFLKNTPAAVRAYGREHPDFPHETTGDQFFSESQFESYHVLGWKQVRDVLGNHAPTDLRDFFRTAEAHCSDREPPED